MLMEHMLILGAAEGGLPMKAPKLWSTAPDWLTNSMFVSVLVAVALIAFAQYSTRNIQLIPGRAQNFWEIIIEKLSGTLEGILGWDLLKKTFWFFASIFLFIIACNIQALLPGVGTIGFGYPENATAAGSSGGFHWMHHIDNPFFRGANADVNMTMALAVWFQILWVYWSFKYTGLVGILKHIFGFPGKVTSFLGVIMVIVFFCVGFIEIISLMVRPIALTFRLYGNIYAGEAMIHELGALAGKFAFLALVPVYAFELLVAVVQALVFCLLCAVFTALMCRHDDKHAPDEHESEEKAKAH